MSMMRLTKRRLVQKGFSDETSRGAVHMLHMSLKRDISNSVNACFELLERGVMLCEVSKLSGLPEHTLSHLVKSRGAQVRRAGRPPKNLDIIIRNPIHHLQLSAFLVGLDLQRTMMQQEALDAETYLAAIHRAERAGLPISQALISYVGLVTTMWLNKDVSLETCRTCAGVHFVVNVGSGYSVKFSRECPFCTVISRCREESNVLVSTNVHQRLPTSIERVVDHDDAATLPGSHIAHLLSEAATMPAEVVI